MKTPLILTLALLAATPVLAPRAAAQATDIVPIDGIVAVVNEEVVLQSELDARVESVMKQYAGDPSQLPPRSVLEKQLLDRLILQKLQVARAEATGIKVSDAEVDRSMAAIAQQNGLDISGLRSAIEAQGLDYNHFRNNVQDQLLINNLRQRIAQSRVQVSDAEIDSVIRNGQLQRGQMHLGYIMINVPDGATPGEIDAVHAKAEEIKQQIDAGMDFAAAAIRYSNADNALQGGDLGWRNTTELPPAMVEIAQDMQDGQTSAPVRGPNGFYLIKRIGQREQGAHLITEYKARHILIKVSELVPSSQAHAEASAIRKRIEAGEDFAKAARESSQDEATAQLGGELGWFSGTAYGPRVASVVSELKPGEISQPFETQLGWHVLQLEDVRQTDKSGELQRDEARNIVYQRKAEDEYEAFLRQLRSEAYVQIRLPGTEAAKGGAP
ncbi:peptidylprolyl isomerase [Dokdonella sp.]|uniref:peptidylprolyl isomerase n=1 Tax=Dokdonella sp. TaxID=2291710 RepID=UPI0031BC0FD0|nr:peptidylprolyl isomerase [Dokdonella sp.]